MTCVIGYKASSKIYLACDTLISDQSGSGYHCQSKLIQREHGLIGVSGNRIGYKFFQDCHLDKDFDTDDEAIDTLCSNLQHILPYPAYNIGALLTGGNNLIVMMNGPVWWWRLHKEEKYVHIGCDTRVVKIVMETLLLEPNQPSILLSRALQVIGQFDSTVGGPTLIHNYERVL